MPPVPGILLAAIVHEFGDRIGTGQKPAEGVGVAEMHLGNKGD